MNIIEKRGVWRFFDKTVTLILTDEKQLEIIIEDPSKPLFENDERGFSGEREKLYRDNTSLIDICREGQKKGAERLELSYDFFFGGSRRTNYPDSEITLKAFKIIHDVAREHGMSFSASIISPLDIGGGYARKHDETGFQYQYQEGAIDTHTGEYCVEMVLQKQWYNNKGPIELKLEKVLVYAFKEEQIEDTDYFYVNPDEILDISHTAGYEADEENVVITRAGYGYSSLRVFGQWKEREPGYDRCLAVAVYRTPELDYFSPDALSYMKSVIDMHREAGISYQGFYSDEMHIQFDWDLGTHFGPTEINTRYITPNLADEYARRYGDRYKDFLKYLVYFSYHQHDFLDGDEGKRANQHVFGKDEKGIYETWLFRKRYFELLQTRVVDLCIAAKEYAEELFGGPIMTRAHATWQESPTCDRFADMSSLSKEERVKISRYEYTPHYVWSSSIRESISACYDYFKWNDFLTGSGTDHPEGGNIDRNYYAQAFTCSLGVLNKFPYAYCGSWGSPKEVLRRLKNVGITYGNMDSGIEHGHNLVQGISHRLTDVLALYPLELNYVEERFGSWMVQYGYCNYITEEKLLENATITQDGHIEVKGRKYRAVLVLFEAFIKENTLRLLREFVNRGGKLVWISIYPVLSEEGHNILDEWKELFGIGELSPAYKGIKAGNKEIVFEGMLRKVKNMQVLTDMLPDLLYPVVSVSDGQVVARCQEHIVGVAKKYDNGGLALYLGFRPRDDQSCSTGEDVDTLFSILMAAGAYDPNSPEAISRPADSRYIVNRFMNGAVSIANHYRTFYEAWSGQFFRDDKQDEEFLKGRALPPIEIELDECDVLRHTISYRGIDALTYNVDCEGRLIGFAGSNTTGITIDGREYRFTDQAVDITWTLVSENYLCDEIDKLFMIKVNKAVKVNIPLPLESMEGYRVEVCDTEVFRTDRKIPYEWNDKQLSITITDKEVNKWIAVYALKKAKRC
ncbi:MAG: hypothetical protein GX094_01410 [Clostridiales bacterium]|jgi:hypothetical protein|nr:hypothetical protein [Clostridiales bacterium]